MNEIPINSCQPLNVVGIVQGSVLPFFFFFFPELLTGNSQEFAGANII